MGLPQRQVGPLAALKKITGDREHPVCGCRRHDRQRPFRRALLSHDGKPGLVRTADGKDRRRRSTSLRKAGNALPANSKITWKGTLTVPHDGEYWMYLQAMGTNAALKIDGKRLGETGATQGGVHGDILQANQDNVVPTTDGLDNVRRPLELRAGPHAIEVEPSIRTRPRLRCRCG